MQLRKSAVRSRKKLSRKSRTKSRKNVRKSRRLSKKKINRKSRTKSKKNLRKSRRSSRKKVGKRKMKGGGFNFFKTSPEEIKKRFVTFSSNITSHIAWIIKVNSILDKMTTDIETFIMYITPLVLIHGDSESVKYQLKQNLKKNMEDNEVIQKDVPNWFKELKSYNTKDKYIDEMAIATEEKNCIIKQSDALGEKIATLYTKGEKNKDVLHLGVFEDSNATLSTLENGVFEDSNATLSTLENGVSKDEVIKLMTRGEIPYVNMMRKAKHN